MLQANLLPPISNVSLAILNVSAELLQLFGLHINNFIIMLDDQTVEINQIKNIAPTQRKSFSAQSSIN